MNKHEFAVWIWRIAVLCVLIWIGWSAHKLERAYPAGLDYQTEEYLRRIEKSLDAVLEKLRYR
jgi:hypothetical protein